MDDGLPHNATTRIVQDGRGFLWIATGGGVARFDGREFKEFQPPVHGPDRTVRDVAMEDERSVLLLPAGGGVLRLRDGVFSEHPAGAGMTGTLQFLFVEPGGAIWIAGSAETRRFHDGKVEIFGPQDGFNRGSYRPTWAVDERSRVWLAAGDFLGYYEAGRLVRWKDPLGSVITIGAARTGGLWVATGDRLLRMENGALRTIVAGREWTEERAGLQELFEDRNGVLWIPSRRYGLSRLAGGHIVRTPISHEQAVSVTEDSEGNVWVSTGGGGIERLRPQTFVLHDASTGMLDDLSTSVCEDGNGTLWAANRRGGLVQLGADKMQAFTVVPGNPNLYATAVCPDPGQGLWVGAIRGLYRFGARPGQGLELVTNEITELHVLLVAANGDVWVGSGDRGENRLGYFRQGLYHALSDKNGYSLRKVRAIAQDARGVIHVGADDRLYGWNEATQRLTDEAVPTGGMIYGLYADARGFLWVATSSGLVLKRPGDAHVFTAAAGLPDDLLSQILEDGNGRLWCGSRRGVFSVAVAELLAVADGRQKRLSAITLGPEEGMRGASAMNDFQPSAWKARDGRLWFTTHEGLFGVDPSASLPLNAPPRVYVDGVRVDQRETDAGGGLMLRPRDQQVEFRFAALNFSSPEKVRVRHRLEGYDYGWTDDGTQRAANYSRLPPGHYTLRVSAANEDGRWNEKEATLAITVRPAWWQTWWFRGVALLVFTAAVSGGVRYFSQRRLKNRLERLERENALAKERSRIARDLHDELGGSLTQIGMLADRLKRKSTDHMLKTELTQLAVRTRGLSGDLESIVWTVSPKNNAWGRLVEFIGLFVQRFFRDTAIECVVEIGAEAVSGPVNPEVQHHLLAVVKEALNNILKHAQASRVSLTVKFSDGWIEFQLIDNGLGFNAAPQEHTERNGLNNMRTRMAEIGGTIEFARGRNGGTELVVRCPLAAPRVLVN